MYIDRVDAKLKKLEEEYRDRVRAYLRPLIQAEFNKVHERMPEVTKIMFGNGTSALIGYNEDAWKLKRICRGLYGCDGEFHLSVPSYMRNLVLLCERAAYEFAPDDIVPQMKTAHRF